MNYSFICFLISLFLLLPCQNQAQELISKQTIKRIKPSIDIWLKYYNLNIKDFTQEYKDRYELQEFDEVSVFCTKLSEKDWIYKPKLREYSQDKHYYIPLYEFSVMYDEESKKYYGGWDDSQSVWLYDKTTMQGSVVKFNGVGSITEAAYWIDKNSFVLLGYEHIEEYRYTITLYDLKNMVTESYVLKAEKPDDGKSFYHYNLGLRGIEVED